MSRARGDAPNVAVVVLDTLRKDTFDATFDWLPGLRFERAFAPADFTAPAHASLFTGRYPTEHGTVAKRRTLGELPTLAEQLREAGYRTRGISANPHITAARGFDRGFDELRDAWRYDDFTDVFDWSPYTGSLRRRLRGVARCLTGSARTLRSLRHGVDTLLGRETKTDKGARSAVEAVRRLPTDGREFLFLNLMEVHDPYVAPASYLPDGPVETLPIDAPLAGADGTRQRAAYEACAAYLSDVYRELFDELTATFDIVVTCSDHGHSFGEYGSWGHGYGVFPEAVHVPLVVWDGESTGTTEATASLLDVHRTVLDAAGCHDAESRGRNLYELAEAGEGPDRLTEFHGLYSHRVTWLRDHGYDESTVERWDATRRGLASADGYAFDSPDGLRFADSSGTEEVDDERATAFADRVDALVDGLDEMRGDDRAEPVTDKKLHDRLEDLGYL